MKTYQMNNGLTIPALGFGTYLSKDGEEVYQAVLSALEAGYRHIDTATFYGNEESIGRAIQDSGIPERNSLSRPNFGMTPMAMRKPRLPSRTL